MIMKDLNKLSKEIFEANKAKGFHEEEHSVKHMLCLVISELMEAVEADRNGYRSDMTKYNKYILAKKDQNEKLTDEQFSGVFLSYIKDSVEDELADAVIRLLDTAGALGMRMDTPDLKFEYDSNVLTEYIYDIIATIVQHKPFLGIPHAIVMLDKLCGLLDIDLWKHVELKLKYNSLRPYKHGKNY